MSKVCEISYFILSILIISVSLSTLLLYQGMERLQGVIAQAVYMDPGVKHNAERTRALGEAMLNSFSPFSTRNEFESVL